MLDDNHLAIATPLTPAQALAVLAVQAQAEAVHTESEFLGWAQGPLQTVLPHGAIACGVVSLLPAGVGVRPVLHGGWPESYFRALTWGDGLLRCPLTQRWMHARCPQWVDTSGAAGLGDAVWAEVFHDTGLNNLLTHGTVDTDMRSALCFHIARQPTGAGAQQAAVLRLLAPHMALALRRVMSAPGFDGASNAPSWLPRLTERERLVLHWMRHGKTNWEIAQICGRSEHTIKNQVERVRQKLQVANRAQACALAADTPLIAQACA